MALYDKASLVLIPSGTKEGVCFSQKPTNGDGDFTFSRSTSATRVGPSGYIEKETQNLLLQSNSFTTGWGLSNVTMTSGQAGYDGTNDAWLMTDTNSGAYGIIDRLVTTGGITTFSCYAKSGTTDIFGLRPIGGSSPYVFFDLSNGTFEAAGDTANLIDWDIQDAGSGWYRCSVTTSATATQVLIYIATTGGALAPSGSTIYIQDAQLEQGLVARDYIETTTSAVYGGITDNIPRLDYTDSSCPALLLEPQRTNLVDHSEYIGSLTPEKGTITSNADTSPEGVVNATSFVEDSTTGRHRTSFFESVTSGQTYTFSMFAKIKSGTRLLCINNIATIGARAYFDLVNGDVEGIDNGTASIEDYGNGWYRCSVTATSSITGNATTYFGLEDGVVDNGYTGDGTSGHYWYGLQLEAGSYATSYIPTYGGAAVTRNSENNIIASATDLIGQTEGTMYYEFNSGKNDGADYVISLSDGSSNNRIVIYRSSANQLIAQIRASAVTYAQLNTSVITENVVYKVALGYANNDVVFYVNGVQIGTDTSATIPLTNRIATDNSVGSATFGRPINQLLLFKTRLSNEELEALTQV